MRNVGLHAARAVLGGYLAVHGAQKLFGSFGGHGLDATGAGFESLGLHPGKAMAALAGASQLGGGILTATAIAEPLGPVMLAGTMVVASTVHRTHGPFSQNGGFELPLTNLAFAVALLSAGSAAVGPRLPRALTRVAVVASVALGVVTLTELLSAHPPGPVTSGDEGRADATNTGPDAPDPVRDPG